MNPAYSKFAAVAILLFLLLGTWMLLAEPYIDLWQERVTQAERLQRKQNALRALIDQHEHFEQHHKALSESESLRAVFLDDKPGALADAKLQRIVREAVEQAGGRVLQVAIAKTRAANQAGYRAALNKPNANWPNCRRWLMETRLTVRLMISDRRCD